MSKVGFLAQDTYGEALERGLPDVLRTDNGPEFLSGEFIAWAEAQKWRRKIGHAFKWKICYQ